MRLRTPLALSVLAAGSALAGFSTVRASDHLDGPRATADPPADIADVFAFTSPENQSHVVLAMTVTPFAPAAAAFSSQVDYAFRVQRVTALQPLTLDSTVLDVTCAFSDGAGGGPQQVTCTTSGGMSLTTAVGDTTGGGTPQSAMRVFAGPRSDPAFFDRQGALASVANGRASFTGQNAFGGANVLAIVVELDTTKAFSDGGTTTPTLAVAGETVRRGH